MTENHPRASSSIPSENLKPFPIQDLKRLVVAATPSLADGTRVAPAAFYRRFTSEVGDGKARIDFT
jgi:hypothetical protein